MLRINDLVMDYPMERGMNRALHGISLAVEPGEFFTLLGPSGCGKTTTLRSVAGLEAPTGGTIDIGHDRVVDAARKRIVPPNRRDISMVFQSYAIWPHMSVLENVAFPLRAMGQRDVVARAEAALAGVGLGGYADRPATRLSGGQQQRVALARAVVKDAKLLLLDEPLSNLDAKLREQMRAELRELQERLGTTTLYVTHDQEEALSLSDRIAVMKDGRVVEVGTPRDLYLRPRSAFTARFIGQAELIPCTPLGPDGDGYAVETALGRLIAGINAAAGPRAEALVIRPEHIALRPAGQGGPNTLPGEIASVTFAGRIVEYRLRVGRGEITAQTLSSELLDRGEAVTLHLPPERCVLVTDAKARAAAA